MPEPTPEPGPGDEPLASSRDEHAACPGGEPDASPSHDPHSSPVHEQAAAPASPSSELTAPAEGAAPAPAGSDPIEGAAPAGSDQPTPSAGSGPTFVWVPGSELPGVGLVSGEVPPEVVSQARDGGCGGLDGRALLEALAAGGFLDGRGEDEVADELAARDDGRMGPALSTGQVAALAVEHMDPGPAQAGWLGAALAQAASLDEYGLTGVVMAGRALASWAQRAELAAVAQLTARTAAADADIGILPDGRPARVSRDALGQVSLALLMNDYDANWWADLAVTLAWRLPATGAALGAGRIDLDRAKVIAEATSLLSQDAARAVEARVLAQAGQWTVGKLRRRVRSAVIAADPQGAERRRQQAERSAQVRLFGDDDGTATLTGSKLPAVEAAAAMARITAIAKAMKASGQAGGLDVHRAKVMLGLLLDTLPYIPPADGAPPDPPPSSDDPAPGRPGPGDPGPGGPGHGHGSGGPGGHGREDRGSSAPGSHGPGGHGPGGHGPGGHGPGGGGSGRRRGPGDGADRTGPAGPGHDSSTGSGDQPPAPRDEDTSPGDGLAGLPAPRDEDAPPADGLAGPPDPAGQWDPAEDDDPGAAGPVGWPALGTIPPALARPPAPEPGRPVPGLLDITLPWTTLAGLADGPGLLGRIGPITPHQARQLATTAEGDPAAQWRIIITSPAGHAIAITRLRRPTTRAGPTRAGQPAAQHHRHRRAPSRGPGPGARPGHGRRRCCGRRLRPC
jgi:Domain of unknown function (DUF222)